MIAFVNILFTYKRAIGPHRAGDGRRECGHETGQQAHHGYGEMVRLVRVSLEQGQQGEGHGRHVETAQREQKEE